MSVEIVEPKKKIYVWLPQWKRYLKSIPKKGLNNLQKNFSYSTNIRPGEPTLKHRLQKLRWKILPFFYCRGSMIMGDEKETLPDIQELTKEIIKQLESLYDKMDYVYVLKDDEKEYWKTWIKNNIRHIKTQSVLIGLDLARVAEFKVLEV